jgi:restriction endonuclease S subunit
MSKVKLKDIVSIRTGYAFRGKVERDPGGTVGVIQMKDIDNYNCLDLNDVYKVQIEDLDKRHLLRQNDILFRSRGVSNTAALVEPEVGQTVASAPLTVIRVKSRQANPAYVTWYINQPQGQEQIKRLSEGTSLLMVSKAALEILEIDLPPLDKQKAIVEMAALSQREQQLMNNLARKRKAFVDAVLIRQAKAE